MARKGENIYKRADGRWEGRYKCGYKDNGKVKYKSVYSSSYNNCKKKLIKAKNSYIENRKTEDIKMTVKKLFDIWFSIISLKVKKSTLDTYMEIYKNHIVGYMGGMLLQEITADFLNKFVKCKLDNGRINGKGGLSPKTVINIISVIKACFKYAEKVYNINNSTKFIVMPRIEKNKIEVLTDDEISKIREYCKNNSDYFSVVYELSISTGIRIGELCALQREDIDFNNGILKITKTVQRIKNIGASSENKTKVVISSPKTKNSAREIPLNKKLIEILKIYTKDKKDSDYVFSLDHKKPLDVRTVQKQFAKALKACNIRKVKFHILRHTFATKWVNANLNTKILSDILGHSSINITLSLYVHPTINDKRNEMDKLFVA